MKQKFDFSAFWEKAKFKYKLSFLNENTLEEVFSLKLSPLSATLLLAGFAVVMIALTSVVIIKTPIRNYLPGYLDDDMREQMLVNSLKTDSLEEVIRIQSSYLDNINSLLNGTNKVATMPATDTTTIQVEEFQKSERLTEFVRTYEEEEKYNLNAPTSSLALPENLIFYKPVRGYVSSHFDLKEKHFGIDIAAKSKESVLATMRGTVIFAGFEAMGGYVIELQHPSGVVSIYKHNAVLLKKQGETVNAGEAIAIVGNSGTLSNGTHLHFELWNKGTALNPEEFIVF
ncbi:MAG: M23 family metallopeptidase [Candidatus Symbiothrix sp.]|jgi:murein DD-endopeptidase MepM/ murein hydrolase activator NlpD|nr:M23 family metallopeptidase [Candidatus Symbiothrix sp.]